MKNIKLNIIMEIETGIKYMDKFCKENNLTLNVWLEDRRGVNKIDQWSKEVMEECILCFVQIKDNGKSVFEKIIVVEDNDTVLKHLPILFELTPEQQKPMVDFYIKKGKQIVSDTKEYYDIWKQK